MTTEQKTALITGATSGIGAAFARRFARDGYALVLTGRRAGEIGAVADTLRAEHGVDVRVILAELSEAAGQDRVLAAIRETPRLEVLVNNAGFGLRGRFHEAPIDELMRMLNVHAAATSRLTHAALPSMLARGSGAIINVSSIAAFQPYPGNAMYGASKLFVNGLSEALHLELRGTGVRVQALCPGLTRTNFQARLGERPVYPDRGLRRAMNADEVVESSLAALAKDQAVCVPGLHNRFVTLMTRKLPRPFVYRVIGRMFDGRASSRSPSPAK
ncbi:MAG TPA: SDR family oxidoreductase [Gammaproteobacteria bacterium]|nr:SDR family oxidoreductase [Gammaproteobacteria bacterium]